MGERTDFSNVDTTIPLDLMQRVLDGGGKPESPADDQDYDSAPAPAPDSKALHEVNIQLEKVADEVAGINASLTIIDTKIGALEEVMKKEGDRRVGRHIDRIENALAEIKTKIREEVSVFDKDVIRAMFDNVDEKLKALHRENMKRKEEYAEIGDTVATRTIKWALVFSAAFSSMCAFLLVILSMILR